MPALCWGTLTLLIMAAIFFFSSDTAGASNAKSGLFVSLLAPLAAWIDTDILSFLIRKAAHFSIYALLGISAYMTLHSANIKRPQWSLVICILYACSDELHQLAVSGRRRTAQRCVPGQHRRLVRHPGLRRDIAPQTT